MQTGIISFGDRVAWNIKCNNIKDVILNELLSLYNVRIIQKHYYNIDDNNIKYIAKLPHLISLRSNGNRYYIYFSLYNDTPIIYFIDMKIHTGYEKPRIILGRGLFDPSLFKNTLLEGEMIKTNDNKWIFIINDIIAYEGNKLDNVILPERLKIIYNLLDKKYTPDIICDVCSYKVKNYYYLSKKSLNELMTISKELNYTSRGIYFSSYYLKHKPKLYNFNDNIIVSVQKKIKDTTEFKELPLLSSSSLSSLSSLSSTSSLPSSSLPSLSSLSSTSSLPSSSLPSLSSSLPSSSSSSLPSSSLPSLSSSSSSTSLLPSSSLPSSSSSSLPSSSLPSLSSSLPSSSSSSLPSSSLPSLSSSSSLSLLSKSTTLPIIATSNIVPVNPILDKKYTDLWVSKTDDPDIYNMYDNHNILTSNKLGIAFIASLQDSIKMRNIFKDKSTTITIKFKCNYNEKFKKFQPIEQII
jgi:hypothetical protein